MTNVISHFKDLRPGHDLFSKSMLYITVLVIHNIVTLMLIYTILPYILYIYIYISQDDGLPLSQLNDS